MRILLLLAIACAALPAQQTAKSAFLNPRVSSRNICLNQTVQVSFVTLKPQVEGVDAEAVITAALQLPNVLKRWRVVGRPKVEVDDKIKTLKASYKLLPRKTGLLPLPEIPVKWLAGNTVGRMGDVEVYEKIQMGTERLLLPDELKEVGGYPWGTSLEELLKLAGKEGGVVDPATGYTVITPKKNLDLLVREDIFAAARIHAPGMNLRTARHSFLERWGDPIGEVATDAGTVITWMFGWIRVEAHGHGDGTILYVIHEEIESRLAKAAVDRNIFNLLDSDDTRKVEDDPAPEAPEKAPARGETEDAAKVPDPVKAPEKKPATSRKALDVDDFIREFERKKKEHQQGVPR